MRRKALCVISDIEPRRFDTLLMRGQVPFRRPESGWGEYTLDDAFRLRLMLDFIDNGGCEILTAVKALDRCLNTNWMREYPLTPKRPTHDMWLAAATISYANQDEPDEGVDFVAGPYHAVPQLVQGIGENVAAATDGSGVVFDASGELVNSSEEFPDYAPGRIIMVNASLVSRKVIHAAELLDMQLTEADFPKLPTGDPASLSFLHDAVEGWQMFLERTKARAED